jgi:hypothetical protein
LFQEIHHVTKRTVFSVDARNHGDSPRTKVMSYATMAKDIEQFVTQIGAPKISFLGKNNNQSWIITKHNNKKYNS